VTLALSPRARKALTEAGLSDETDVARAGWRRVKDAGADMATLQEIEAALGCVWPELPAQEPETWIVGSIAIATDDPRRAKVVLTGDSTLRVPMTMKEARALKVGDVVRVKLVKETR
jgi:hypothetical protein